MKKTLKTKVEVTANVTYMGDGQMEVTPMMEQEVFEHEASFRARVKVSRTGKTVVKPVREGCMGRRYDVLLDTSCGCVKATRDKVFVQLSVPKKLGNDMIARLLHEDMQSIYAFLRFADLDFETVTQRA